MDMYDRVHHSYQSVQYYVHLRYGIVIKSPNTIQLDLTKRSYIMEKLSNIIEILAYVQYYVHLRYGIVMKSPNMDKLNIVNEHPILT
ncbi:hypothetical protein AAZX31_03G106500 [Glycine max]